MRIGEYIHYHSEYYRELGLGYYNGDNRKRNLVSGSPMSEATAIFINQKNKILSSMAPSPATIQECEQLSELLTNLVYNSKDLKKEDSEMFSIFSNQISKDFSETFNNKFNITDGLEIYGKPKPPTNTTGVYLSTIQKYENELQKIIDRLASGVSNASKKGGNVQSAINNIRLVQNRIRDFVNQESKRKEIDPEWSGYFSLKNDSSGAGALLEDIKTAYALEAYPDNQARGWLWEYYLAYASYILNNKTGITTDELIDDFMKEIHKGFLNKKGLIMVGSEVSEVKMNSDYFDKNFVDMVEMRLSANVKAELHATQDKCDVNFQWGDKLLKVTAKNYKLKDSSAQIHLVSDTNLLYLIQNENPDFVNHWLNLMSINHMTRSQSAILQRGHIAMKITVFMKALSGQGIEGRDSGAADTMMLNWRSQSRVLVFSLSDLVKRVSEMKDLDAYVNFGPNFTKRFSNNWEPGNGNDYGSAKQRITKVLAEVRSRNLTIQLKQRALGLVI